MLTIIRNLWKQGISGQYIVIALCLVGVSGALTLAVGVVCGIWFLVAVHGFGAQPIDFWTGLGVVLALAIIVGIFRKWGE